MQQILIVEDDTTLNQGLCKALADENRKTVSCENIADAKAQLALGTVSLVLLDINLPDGNGIEFLRAVKAENGALPVILVSANDTDADIVAGLDRGRMIILRSPSPCRYFGPESTPSFGKLHRSQARMSMKMTPTAWISMPCSLLTKELLWNYPRRNRSCFASWWKMPAVW